MKKWLSLAWVILLLGLYYFWLFEWLDIKFSDGMMDQIKNAIEKLERWLEWNLANRS